MARHRSAVTGRMVSKKDAATNPRETVRESGPDKLAELEARIAKLEAVIVKGEAAARRAYETE